MRWSRREWDITACDTRWGSLIADVGQKGDIKGRGGFTVDRQIGQGRGKSVTCHMGKVTNGMPVNPQGKAVVVAGFQKTLLNGQEVAVLEINENRANCR